MRLLPAVALALGGCAHFAAEEASVAYAQAAERNTASFDAALSAALRDEGATLLPPPAQVFDPERECYRPGGTVVLKQATGAEITAECSALQTAIRDGNALEVIDGSGAEVTLIFAAVAWPSVLGRTKDGGFVHFKQQPQVVTRTMTIVTPGLSCCCDVPREQPRPFWVLPGHHLGVRSAKVSFQFEHVELKCDPRAPQ